MAYVIKDESGNPVKHDGSEVFAVDMIGSIKTVNKDNRSIIIVGSDETKDRDGDIIMVHGWKMDNFLKNPVFLYAHNHSGVPIGSATKVIRRKNPARLEFHEKFPTAGVYPFADMILALFQEKVLNASSVGFVPTKWEELAKDEQSPNRFYPGRRYTEQELLELSACAVPSNPSALQLNSLAKSIMAKSVDEIKEMMEPKDRDLILEQLYVKEIEFDDENRPLQVQIPATLDLNRHKDIVDIVVEDINKSRDEEFVTVKGEHENKTVEENMDMEIKELLEKLLAKLEGMPTEQKLADILLSTEAFDKKFGIVNDQIAEIKSFITNLTKSDKSDTNEEEVDNKSVSKDEAEDLYKETLSQTDNKEDLTEEKANGLSKEEEDILKQVTLNLKDLFKGE